MNEIQLPDYLPSRYRSWLHLYLDIQNTLAALGELINENTTVKLYDLVDYEEQKVLQQYPEEVIHFYQNFPITTIKARAFDYMLSRLPSFEKMYEVTCIAMSTPYADKDMNQVFIDLLDICPENRR